uniref:Uncharacterized protein n=1 Tax=Anopheles albimanus TaxID=7167 RepID=A0A182F153_ANOAL
ARKICKQTKFVTGTRPAPAQITVLENSFSWFTSQDGQRTVRSGHAREDRHSVHDGGRVYEALLRKCRQEAPPNVEALHGQRSGGVERERSEWQGTDRKVLQRSTPHRAHHLDARCPTDRRRFRVHSDDVPCAGLGDGTAKRRSTETIPANVHDHRPGRQMANRKRLFPPTGWHILNAARSTLHPHPIK